MALAAAIRRMPSTTDALTWTAHLPPIRGVIRPVWTKLDPAQHMKVMLAAYFNDSWVEVLHPARAKELREKYGAEIEARIRAGIADGSVALEETSVPTIRFEGAPGLAEPMGLYRVTRAIWSDFTVAGRRPRPVLKPGWIVAIRSLPTTHPYDLRPNGRKSDGPSI